MPASTSLGLYLLFFFYSDPTTNVCPPQRADLDCTDFTFPVCVYYKGQDCDSTTGYCQRDEPNFCSACVDNSVVGYDYGECSESSVHICTKDELESTCSANAEPVCGFSVEGNGWVAHETINNACSACTDEIIAFYTKGECDLGYIRSNGTDRYGDATIVDTLRLGQGVGGFYPHEEESAEYVLTSSLEDSRTDEYSLSVTTYQSGVFSTRLTRNHEQSSSERTSVRYFD